MIDLDSLVIGPTLDVFGETVTIHNFSCPPVTFQGVFDRAYLAVDPVGGDSQLGSVNVTTRMPVLGVRLSQMPTPPFQGMELIIRDDIFSVKEVQPDGHGHAKLLLNLGSYEP